MSEPLPVPSEPTPPAPVSPGPVASSQPTVVQALVQRATRLIRPVRSLSTVSVASALWIWGVAAWPFGFTAWWAWALMGIFLVALLLPGALLVVCYLGLREVVNLPEALRTVGDASMTEVGTLQAATQQPERRRVWRIGRSLYELGSLAVEAKGLLLGSVALVRMLNPFTLLLLAASTLISGLLALVAVVLLLVVVI